MSKSNAFETDILKLIFNGTSIPGIADNAAASPLTTYYCALHTSDPGEAGDQTTNEISYPGYARVGILRTAGALPVTGGTMAPAAAIEFPSQASGGAQSAPFWSLGTLISGAGKILYSGPVSPPIPITTGVIPVLMVGTTVTED